MPCATGATAPSMPAPDRQPAEAGPAAVLKSKAPTWLPSAHAIYFYCLWLPTALLFLLTKMFDGKGGLLTQI